MRSNKLYLRDIIDACNNICEYTQGMNYEDFFHDKKTCDAVIKNITVIGEAVSKLSDSIKRKNSSIDWVAVKGMRNIFAHEYFNINLRILWNTVQNYIPELIKAIDDILKEDTGI